MLEQTERHQPHCHTHQCSSSCHKMPQLGIVWQQCEDEAHPQLATCNTRTVWDTPYLHIDATQGPAEEVCCRTSCDHVNVAKTSHAFENCGCLGEGTFSTLSHNTKPALQYTDKKMFKNVVQDHSHIVHLSLNASCMFTIMQTCTIRNRSATGATFMTTRKLRMVVTVVAC